MKEQSHRGAGDAFGSAAVKAEVGGSCHLRWPYQPLHWDAAILSLSFSDILFPQGPDADRQEGVGSAGRSLWLLLRFAPSSPTQFLPLADLPSISSQQPPAIALPLFSPLFCFVWKLRRLSVPC